MRTKHGRHNSHAGVLLILVGSADAKVVDGVQAKRVQPGRDVALGSHSGEKLSISIKAVTSC